jgi:hypothetical protein
MPGPQYDSPFWPIFATILVFGGGAFLLYQAFKMWLWNKEHPPRD